MNAKKLLSALCAGAILMSSLTIGLSYSSTGSVYAEDGNVEEPGDVSEDPGDNGETGDTEDPGETKPLSAPQNLRFEDGFIKWDKVEEAYGYILRVHVGEEEWEYQEFTKYFDYDDPNDEAQVEFDRLCYEQQLDFGEYIVNVCSFDQAQNRTEWSEGIIAEYSPTLVAPANVRASEEEEDMLLWDEVEGAYKYNIRVYNDDEDRTLYTNHSTRGTAFYYHGRFSESGNFWFSVQTMDQNYNVSEWTEPISISYTYNDAVLDAPQNVRFDETGETILWDEVEGAEYYQIAFGISYVDEKGREKNIYEYDYPSETHYSNWKRFVVPYSNAKYSIYICACGNASSSNNSETIEISFDTDIDDSVAVPEIKLEGNYLQWDGVESAENYWLIFTVNGQTIIEDNTNRYDANYESYSFDTNYFPAGDYEATLYVVDKNLNYNKKTYSFTFGSEPDKSVWIPKPYYKLETLLWDYDQIRHDNTYYFWVRVTNEASGEVVRLGRTWGDGFYDSLNNLPNAYYNVEVCAYEYDCKFGSWAKLEHLEKHGDSYFDDNNEIKGEIITPPEAEEIPKEERVTEISINPAWNIRYKDDDEMAIDLSLFYIKAEEIYDEEGLERASEALGKVIEGDKHYNLLDLTLLYNGEDFSESYNGLVKVTMALPKWFKDKEFCCFRIKWDDEQKKFVKEIIPGEQTEDSYIIYLEHFSEYALVADPNEEEEHEHVFSDDWKNNETNHWKECECGEKSEEAEHTYTDWTITKEATETEKGSKERTCEVCGYKQEEEIPVLSHEHSFADDWKNDETNHWKECECGEKSEEAEHTYTDWKVTKEATETEKGSKERTCEVCGYKQEEEIPALSHEHSFADDWKNDETNHWKECECGEKSEVKEHKYTEWKVVKAATETEEGLKERACEICGFKQSESLPKLTPAVTPEPDKEPNMPTGFTAVETSTLVLAVCSAAAVILSRKRRNK